MSHTSPSYRGFNLEILVFLDPDTPQASRKHERLLAVSVRITPNASIDSVPPSESRVFRLETVLFDSIGNARRAGDEFGRTLIDGFINKASLEA
ncbi:hypothetical protein [Pandoraea sp. NPDC090278]|uniref:hypothetical protein n=1 Tax=Pandoraea sp. NPDC090278 TaxID=3364391 RepID=UPI00383B0B26